MSWRVLDLLRYQPVYLSYRPWYLTFSRLRSFRLGVCLGARVCVLSPVGKLIHNLELEKKTIPVFPFEMILKDNGFMLNSSLTKVCKPSGAWK